jgi:hypothetical protein
VQAAELAPLPTGSSAAAAAFIGGGAAAADAQQQQAQAPSALGAEALLQAQLPPVCSVSGYTDEAVARLGGSHWDVCVQLAGPGGGGGVAVAEGRPDLRCVRSGQDWGWAVRASAAPATANQPLPAPPSRLQLADIRA